MSFKELAIALKEAKAGGAYVEGGTSLHTLLTQLSLRMQDQGHNFKKVCSCCLPWTHSACNAQFSETVPAAVGHSGRD